MPRRVDDGGPVAESAYPVRGCDPAHAMPPRFSFVSVLALSGRRITSARRKQPVTPPVRSGV